MSIHLENSTTITLTLPTKKERKISKTRYHDIEMSSIQIVCGKRGRFIVDLTADGLISLYDTDLGEGTQILEDQELSSFADVELIIDPELAKTLSQINEDEEEEEQTFTITLSDDEEAQMDNLPGFSDTVIEVPQHRRKTATAF